MSSALVLIVEDERQIAEIFQAFFEREGFRVAVATNGVAALDMHRLLMPDLVVLDVKLPKLDGVEVLAELRRRGSTPVIMSTALGEDLEKLTALSIGADDYMVKPFNPLELVARAKAILRRVENKFADKTILRVMNVEIDVTAHQAWVIQINSNRVAIDVTPTEFRLLCHMARAPRKAFTRSELVDACLPGDGDALDRTVDSHVSNLRIKLEASGAAKMLNGVRGVGYRLATL